MSDAIRLTDEQERALAVLQQTIDAGEGGQVVLRGYAGTGKTTVVQELVRRNRRRRIVLTAPTNKAVKVLWRKNREAGLDTDCTTIHKLLGVRPGNSDEKRSLKKQGIDSSGSYEIVVIDECSMLNEELMAYIQKALRFHVVIYVGDPQQLPPVGEEMSLAFGVRRQAVLSTIMRQRSENPIIALTADIRAMIDAGEPDWSTLRPAMGTDGSGIFKADGDLEGWITDAFTSPEFQADNDAFRYLAWTNRTVEDVNRFVRAIVYGRDAPPFVEGERLLFRKPVIKHIAGKVTISFNTDDEARITKVDQAEWVSGVPCWALAMEDDDDVTDTAYVVRDDGRTMYERIEAELKEAARQERSKWPDYFTFIEQFADVQPVYALTVHRSQGSTFDSVFVDLMDIHKNRNQVEMLKLLYVAASRPRRFLVI